MQPEHQTRRDFLKLAATTATAGATLPGMASAEDAKVWPKHLIDTHTHFYDPTRPEGVPWPAKGTALYRPVYPKTYKAVVKPLGTTGTVVVEASEWVEDNQWILDLAKEEPFLVGLVGNLPVGEKEFAGHLKRFAKNPLFRGIRLRDQKVIPKVETDAGVIADLKRLADADLALDLNFGPTSLKYAVTVARKVPNLRVVVNHLPYHAPGNKDQQKELDDNLRELAKHHPQVFLKISNVLRQKDGKTITDVEFYRPRLDFLWKLFGPSRVIYGSNWPVSDRAGTYAQVQGVMTEYMLPKGQELTDQYFWKNAKTAYRWVNRES